MIRQRSPHDPASSQPGRPRRIHHQSPAKLPEIARCPDCKASYRKGRWTWKAAPADAYDQTCPACQRIADDYPAAELHVAGGFAASNREEIEGLIRNVEQRERGGHPLKRIMGVKDEGAGFVVTLTDSKLAESCGRALEKAYAGKLDSPPTTSEKENLVRIHWSRD